MINKEIIKRNFSRAAQYYDAYSTVQYRCALKLIDKVKANSLSKILDIGCGTGNYTKLLKDKYPAAQIKAVDISREMVKIAKKKLQNSTIEFIIADAEVVDFKENFDLISSNASFQWFENLEGTLLKYRKLLNKNGVVLFSIFGPLTFYELNKSLKELSSCEGTLISSCNFVEKVRIEKILRSLFRDIEVEHKI